MKKIVMLSLIFLFIANIGYAEKVRVLYKPDGKIVVVYPIEKPVEEVCKELGYDEFPYEDMDSSQLPSREDRDYWIKKEGGGIKVDIEKKSKDIKDKQDKEIALKQKLNLTDEDLIELKDILNGKR